MKYVVIGTEEVFEEAWEAVDSCADKYDYEDDFVEYLNNEYGEIDVCGEYYDAAEVLRSVDEWEFDSQFDRWFDDLKDDLARDLECDGQVEVGGYTIEEQSTTYKIINTEYEFDDADDAVEQAVTMRTGELKKGFRQQVKSDNDLVRVYDTFLAPDEVLEKCAPTEYENRCAQYFVNVHNEARDTLERTGRAEVCDLIIADSDDVEEGGEADD